jgi:hypothetical protein
MITRYKYKNDNGGTCCKGAAIVFGCRGPGYSTVNMLATSG